MRYQSCLVAAVNSVVMQPSSTGENYYINTCAIDIEHSGKDDIESLICFKFLFVTTDLVLVRDPWL